MEQKQQEHGDQQEPLALQQVVVLPQQVQRHHSANNVLKGKYMLEVEKKIDNNKNDFHLEEENGKAEDKG